MLNQDATANVVAETRGRASVSQLETARAPRCELRGTIRPSSVRSSWQPHSGCGERLSMRVSVRVPEDDDDDDPVVEERTSVSGVPACSVAAVTPSRS